MPDTCTPNYLLPYPTGTSRPCDYGATSCAFAKAVEAQLDALDATLGRLSPTVPFALVTTSDRQLFTNDGFGTDTILFDTTLADTDNMVDLGVNNSSITTRTAGVYSIFVAVESAVPAGITSLQVSLIPTSASGSSFGGNLDYFIGNFPTLTSMPVKSNGERAPNACMTYETILNMSAGATVLLTTIVGGTLGLINNIQRAFLGAQWLRDPL